MFDRLIQTAFNGRRSSFWWWCAFLAAFIAVIFITGGSGVLAYTLGAIVIVIGWTGSAILNRRAAKSRPRRDQPEISEPR